MSTRERAAKLFNDLTEYDLEVFIHLFGRLYDVPDTAKHSSDRIGAAKGKIVVPKDFDKWDREIEEMFEGGDV